MYAVNARLWEEQWRDHVKQKFFQERVWLEERMEDIQGLIRRELSFRMERFQKEWKKKEEKKREREDEGKKALEELKEMFFKERQIREEEMREKETALEVALEKVNGVLIELQKEKEQFQAMQEELKKPENIRKEIEAEKREIERERESLRKEKETMAVQERDHLCEIAEQWKNIALAKQELICEAERREMERSREMEGMILEAQKKQDLLLEKIEEKKQASIETEIKKERQEKRIEDERKIIEKKTQMLRKQWKNIGEEEMNIEAEKEAIDQDKRTERALLIHRERLAEKDLQRKKTKMERKEIEIKTEIEEEWRSVEAEKFRIEDEWVDVERKRKLDERQIRRQRKKLDREEEERKRREQEEAETGEGEEEEEDQRKAMVQKKKRTQQKRVEMEGADIFTEERKRNRQGREIEVSVTEKKKNRKEQNTETKEQTTKQGSFEELLEREGRKETEELKVQRVKFSDPSVTLPPHEKLRSLLRQESEIGLTINDEAVEQKKMKQAAVTIKEAKVPAPKFISKTKKLIQPDPYDEFDREMDELLKMD